MSPGIGKCNKIRHIVRIRQMLRRWRKKAALSSSSSSIRVPGVRVPSDVPAGHVGVCVGTSCRRFVVRATYLNHPIFQKLLVQAEEEYGFTNQGPLVIPCDESLFQEILRFVARSESANSARSVNLDDFQRCCHVGFRENLDILAESRPLLHGFADKSVC
ncbi:auxin-responsive protein SAUR71-like [Cornus florida]|uniref:auxin-responsive protein SAUR71-like n=1 Tax=Cornus florida TaxID=4283 RepID=UPI002898BE59|nr:auxin-responsive protein SAUR71-like [Cornus florida]